MGGKMNKEEFNKLDIEQQRIYINSFLTEGISLTKACEAIGIDRATVRKRFKRNGIIFNKNIYIRENNHLNDNTTITTETTTNNKNITKRSDNQQEKQESNDNIKLLEEKIKALESYLKATNKRIDDLINTKTTINTDENIREYKGEEVVRSFRINEEVQKRFKKYCKANSEHKVSDILSTILDDYLKRQDY
jgi:predicted DNA-binding protein YlxM (UPF0122 family)